MRSEKEVEVRVCGVDECGCTSSSFALRVEGGHPVFAHAAVDRTTSGGPERAVWAVEQVAHGSFDHAFEVLLINALAFEGAGALDHADEFAGLGVGLLFPELLGAGHAGRQGDAERLGDGEGVGHRGIGGGGGEHALEGGDGDAAAIGEGLEGHAKLALAGAQGGEEFGLSGVCRHIDIVAYLVRLF